MRGLKIVWAYDLPNDSCKADATLIDKFPTYAAYRSFFEERISSRIILFFKDPAGPVPKRSAQICLNSLLG